MREFIHPVIVVLCSIGLDKVGLDRVGLGGKRVVLGSVGLARKARYLHHKKCPVLCGKISGLRASAEVLQLSRCCYPIAVLIFAG